MKLRKFIMGWFSSDEIITNTASSSSSIVDKFVAGALSVIAILLIFIVICNVAMDLLREHSFKHLRDPKFAAVHFLFSHREYNSSNANEGTNE